MEGNSVRKFAAKTHLPENYHVKIANIHPTVDTDREREFLALLFLPSCVKTFLLSSENHPQMFRCSPQKSTMAQYFSQPFPKPGRNVLHYFLLSTHCVRVSVCVWETCVCPVDLKREKEGDHLGERPSRAVTRVTDRVSQHRDNLAGKKQLLNEWP